MPECPSCEVRFSGPTCPECKEAPTPFRTRARELERELNASRDPGCTYTFLLSVLEEGLAAGMEEAATLAERLSDEWEAKANADNSPHYDDRWGQAVGAEAVAAAIRDHARDLSEPGWRHCATCGHARGFHRYQPDRRLLREGVRVRRVCGPRPGGRGDEVSATYQRNAECDGCLKQRRLLLPVRFCVMGGHITGYYCRDCRVNYREGEWDRLETTCLHHRKGPCRHALAGEETAKREELQALSGQLAEWRRERLEQECQVVSHRRVRVARQSALAAEAAEARGGRREEGRG